MDRIKKLKVKKSDGSFTDYIPIGTDAIYVDLADGDDAESAIARIKSGYAHYYDSIASMKNDTKLKNGDTAVTLGYYNINDGGKASYKIVSSLPDNLAVNNYNVFKLNNNLYAILINNNPFLNIKQFGAYEDGQTSDYLIFKNAISYCRKEKLILQLNKKTYFIDNTLDIDILQDIIEGNNAHILSSTDILFNFESSSTSNPYDNNYTILKNLSIKNIYNNKYGTCFKFNSLSETNALSHINFEDINIQNYNIGIDIVSNSYIISFNHVDIHYCNIAHQMLSGGTNYGERINIINSTIYNNITAFINENVNGMYIITNSSIDYNKIAFKTLGEAFINCSNSHIEGRQQFIGNALISNCWVIILKIEDEYVFTTYNNSTIRFNNCKINGISQEKPLVSNNEGIIEFINCHWINQSAILNNLLNDLSLSNITNYPKCYIGAKNSTLTSYKQSNRGNLTQENNVTTFNKIFGSGSSASFDLLFKRNKNKKRIKLLMDLISDSEGVVYISYYYGNDLSWDGINPILENKKSIGDISINLSDYSSQKTINFINNTSEAPNDGDYLVVHFNCDGMKQNNMILSNFKYQEW